MAYYWVLVDFTSNVYNIPWIGFSQPEVNEEEILFMGEPIEMPGAYTSFWYLDNVVYQQNAASSQIGTPIDNNTDVNSGLDIIKTDGQVYKMSHLEWAEANWDVAEYHLASEFTPEEIVGQIETITLSVDYIGMTHSYTAPDFVWVMVERDGSAPVALDDSGYGFNITGFAPFQTASVLANDSDPEGGVLQVQSTDTTGTHGAVRYLGDGVFEYAASVDYFDFLEPGEKATDSFSYTVVDDEGKTDTATVTITVTGPPEMNFEEIRQLYMTSIVLSDATKGYLDAAMMQSFSTPNELRFQVGASLAEIVKMREDIEGNSVNADLRDAEYYIRGLGVSVEGDLPTGILVAGTPVYNGLKGIANVLGLSEWMRAQPGKPNSPPGGSAAAYEGMLDGLGLDPESTSYGVPFQNPHSGSYNGDVDLF